MILPEVDTLDFIREGRSIVMYGNPGTGKTHVAIGLGIKACLEGYSVFFTSVPRLLTLIREAKTEKTLQRLEMKFERFDLVICDELGYVGFDKEGAEMLFNHLFLRTGRRLRSLPPTCLLRGGRRSLKTKCCVRRLSTDCTTNHIL